MSEEERRLERRVAILETEIAAVSGMLQGIAESLEAEYGLSDEFVQYVHERAAYLRKLVAIKPSGGAQ